MIRRRWFWGLAGAMAYLAGMNDEFLGLFGDWWLGLSRLLHVVIVVVLLALAIWVAVRVLAARRVAYEAAVRAADRVEAPGWVR